MVGEVNPISTRTTPTRKKEVSPLRRQGLQNLSAHLDIGVDTSAFLIGAAPGPPQTKAYADASISHSDRNVRVRRLRGGANLLRQTLIQTSDKTFRARGRKARLVKVRKEEEKNILVLSARVEGPPKFGETHDGRAVCDAPLFIPNGEYRSFKIVASVFDSLAYTRVAELAQGMDVLFVGHLRGFRTWKDQSSGRWLKSWFSGTGDIVPVDGLPDLSAWPPDPLKPQALANESPSPVPNPLASAIGLETSAPALVSSQGNDLPVGGPRPELKVQGAQLDFGGSRRGRYGDPCS